MNSIVKPKLSVIIPVYNAGSFFQKRLDTLLNQTLKEIEIILVLDCPTDGSDKIAKTYASQDNRIILIHNLQNLHIGLSRNEGLKRATGEYISFSDHDDYSELDMFEKMYEKAKETNADVVVSDYYGKSEKQTFFFGFPTGGSDKQFQEDSFSYLISGPQYNKDKRTLTSNGLIWNQIYKKDFLENYSISFPDNRKITFEDRVFLIHVYYHAQIISRLPEAFYYHVYHKGSAGSNYSFRSISLIINYLICVHDFLCNHNIYKQELRNYSDSALLTLYSAFRNEIKHKSFFKAFNELHKIRSNQTIQEALIQLLFPKNLRFLGQYRITKLCFLVLVLQFSHKGNKHRK